MNLLLELTKDLKPHGADKFLLAVSGGMDSMALFQVFLHFKKHFDFHFSVAHFHHGPSSDQKQEAFRFEAAEFVKEQCLKNEIKFFCNWAGEQKEFLKNFGDPLTSEDSFRQARYGFLKSIQETGDFQWIVTAHHQEDLLETRLLRLIRGTGPEGLQAIQFKSDSLMRPLLNCSRKELKEFLTLKNAKWLEDPSNQALGPMRNWLRSKWLQDLENKQPGALSSLHRSLDLLVSSLGQSESLDSFLLEGEINLSELLLHPEAKRRQVLASYMKSQGLRNYGLSHINEILKRLDREEKSHTFRLLGRSWIVDAGRMSVEKPS